MMACGCQFTEAVLLDMPVHLLGTLHTEHF